MRSMRARTDDARSSGGVGDSDAARSGDCSSGSSIALANSKEQAL